MKITKSSRVRAVVVHESGEVTMLDFAPAATWLSSGSRYFVRLGEAYVGDRKWGVLVYAERPEPILCPKVTMFEVAL